MSSSSLFHDLAGRSRLNPVVITTKTLAPKSMINDGLQLSLADPLQKTRLKGIIDGEPLVWKGDTPP